MPIGRQLNWPKAGIAACTDGGQISVDTAAAKDEICKSNKLDAQRMRREAVPCRAGCARARAPGASRGQSEWQRQPNLSAVHPFTSVHSPATPTRDPAPRLRSHGGLRGVPSSASPPPPRDSSSARAETDGKTVRGTPSSTTPTAAHAVFRARAESDDDDDNSETSGSLLGSQDHRTLIKC